MISKHLRVLLTAGLIESRQVGRERHYALSGPVARVAFDLARADEAHHETIKRLRTHLEDGVHGEA